MGQDGANQPTGAEAMVQMLDSYEVEHVFGLCGDTSLPLYDAMVRLDHGITHILTRDERHAAYMADAYARVTGKPGICEGPSGGGATYILPGLVEANESSVPILAITTDVATTSAGRYPLTELDQNAVMRPLTKWNGVIPSSGVLPRFLRRAFREMTTGRPGSVHLGLPFDVQKGPVDAGEVHTDPNHTHYPASQSAPAPADIEAIATALMDARAPVIVCGGGVVLAGAMAALQDVAEIADIVVVTTVSGQGSLAETHPNCAGVVGSNGGQPATRAIVDEADVVLFVGCRAGSVTTERWRSPGPDATIVHIDNDPAVIGACYPTHAAAVGDAKAALELLADAFRDGHVSQKGGAIRAHAALRAKWPMFEALAASSETPIKPERVIASLQANLPDDAVICADPGTPCPYFSAWYRWPRAGRHFITNRAHGALGYALGASIGAQIGRPNAKVVACSGDGSFAMSVGELETITRYNLPITIIVFSNAVFGWIKAGQKSGFDARYFSVDFTRTDHAAVARAYGLKAWTVADPNALNDVVRLAIRHDGPTLIDVIAQPLQDAAAPVSEWIA